MAISVTDQIKILNANTNAAPSASNPRPPGGSLLALVHQSASDFALNFYISYKIFTTAIDNTDPQNPRVKNQSASSYVRKMLQLADLVFRGDDRTVSALIRIMVGLLGASGVTFAQISSATDAQWETFITNNMDTTFELLSTITRAERTQYTTPEV